MRACQSHNVSIPRTAPLWLLMLLHPGVSILVMPHMDLMHTRRLLLPSLRARWRSPWLSSDDQQGQHGSECREERRAQKGHLKTRHQAGWGGMGRELTNACGKQN